MWTENLHRLSAVVSLHVRVCWTDDYVQTSILSVECADEVTEAYPVARDSIDTHQDQYWSQALH